MPDTKMLPVDLDAIFPDPARAGRTKAIQAKLLADIQQACAWGIPDRESTGYSAGEFVDLLWKAKCEIERLQSKIDHDSTAAS